ncbi:hypothetical protein [Pseudoalteromonas denitrificans]|uniref:DUF4402 domain-containing protein n=1 Tax=Pseudoalteromonas denitrificans DSM 6059 TaxID=1123010 RepID=A0A1I1HP88_9GAMM|nr:hypothetical protein [Pseudoalteromonas denitrificans]SFC25764.1 hypothetical protein SAMN02745724_01285 [Pseudoalteromonas denitrificans DSM 6059]
MNKGDFINRMLCLVAILGSLNTNAANKEIMLQKIKNLDFDTVLPKTGSCYYDSQKNNTIRNTKDSTCSSYSGSNGKFKLTAEPFQIVEIEFKSKKSPDGQVIFQPEGVAKIELDEFAIYTNTPTKLKLGPSGVIDIVMGGKLIFINELSHGLNYSLDYDINYKYSHN